jgi:hypothetical protein
MPVREMCDRMTAHEISIEWPAYDAAKAKLAEHMQKLEGSSTPEQFDKQFQTMGGGS